MKVISICNQKGGAGKTTTAAALWGYLREKGKKVLAVDMDGQHNLSFTAKAKESPSILGVLMGEVTAKAAIQHTPMGDIIPGVDMLSNADALLEQSGKAGKEYRLKKALEPLAGEYEYCILDTPPHLGVLILNALTAAHDVIIPAQADIYNLQGIGQLIETVDTVREYCNSSLQVLGIALTRYNERTNLSKDVKQTLTETAREMNLTVCNATIREATAIKEAQAAGKSIIEYAPGAKVTADYKALFDELNL